VTKAPVVLLVDDDPAIVELLRNVLSKDGYDIRTADDPRDAIALLARDPVDVLITDFAMPGMTGLQLLVEIRKTHPDLPVVMVTGEGTMDTGLKAMDHGALSYLSKPVDPDDLRRVVKLAAAKKT
jgi:DNA-binding NtrC family response regulator